MTTATNPNPNPNPSPAPAAAAPSPFELTATTAMDPSKFPVPPAGAQVAVCIGIIDLGADGATYDNGKSEWVRRVYFLFELTGSQGREVVGKDFTLKFSSKAKLREFVTNWRNGQEIPEGSKFNITVLVGKPCVLTIKHTTKQGKDGPRTYAGISGISYPIQGVVVPGPTRCAPFVWSVGQPDFPAYDWLPRIWGEKVHDVIAEGKRNLAKQAAGEKPPAKGANGQAAAGEDYDHGQEESIPEGSVPF